MSEREVRLKEAIKDLENYSQENIDRKNNEHLIQAAAKVQQTLKLFRERLTLKKLNKHEVEQLREKKAIAREYLLKYDSEQRQTRIEPGYF